MSAHGGTLLAGPMDFTPGIFDILERSSGHARQPWEPRVRTTLAKQLALYVVIYSPLQMAADRIRVGEADVMNHRHTTLVAMVGVVAAVLPRLC